MNDLRIPAAALAVAVLAFGAWLFYVRQNATIIAAPAGQNPVSGDAHTSQLAQNSAPSLSESAVAEAITATWQSTDDPNYSIVIAPDGTWTDRYKDANASISVSETGEYTLFTSANPDPGLSGPPVSGVVYVKLIEGRDMYYYSVLQASGNELQLSYLARGNTLSFVKVQ